MPVPISKENRFVQNKVNLDVEKIFPSQYLSGSHVTILGQNLDLRYSFEVNPRIFEGISLIGKSDQQVFDPLEAERLKLIKDEVLATGKATHSDILLTVGNKRYFFEGYFSPLIGSSGVVGGVISVLSDITHRKDVEYSLLSESEKGRAILENVTDPIWFKNNENKYLFVNSSFAKIVGLGRDEIINKKDEDLPWSLEVRRTREEQFWKAVSNKKKETITEKIVDPSGNTRWFESSIIPIFIEASRLLGVVAISREITERLIFEEKLTKTNRALIMTLACSRVPLKVSSENDILKDICRIIVEFGGYRLCFIGYFSGFENTIRTSYWCGFEEGYTTKINQGDPNDNPYLKAAKTGKPVVVQNIEDEKTTDYWKVGATARGYRSFVVLPLKINGDAFAVLSVFSEFSSAFTEEELIYLTEISDDLSFGVNFTREKEKSKEITTSLAESENKFRKLAESSPFSIFLYRDKFLYVNRAGELLSGYSADETKEMFFWQIVHPEFRELIKGRGLSRLKGESVPSRYEFKILRKDGKDLWVDFTGSLIEFGGFPTGLGIAFDITDKKIAESVEKERALELEKLNNLMIGRELKMLELKKENEELRKRLT